MIELQRCVCVWGFVNTCEYECSWLASISELNATQCFFGNKLFQRFYRSSILNRLHGVKHISWPTPGALKPKLEFIHFGVTEHTVYIFFYCSSFSKKKLRCFFDALLKFSHSSSWPEASVGPLLDKTAGTAGSWKMGLWPMEHTSKRHRMETQLEPKGDCKTPRNNS